MTSQIVTDPVARDFALWSRNLSRLLEMSGASNFRLPPLREEPSWSERLRQYAADLLEQLFRGHEAPVDLKNLAMILIYLAAAGLVVVVITVALRIARRLLAAGSKHEKLMDSSAWIPIGHAEHLQSLLREALERHQWSNAARLRWKLFLSRLGASGSTTPLEYFRDDRDDSPAADAYRIMFGPVNSSYEKLYGDTDRRLHSLEKNIR